MKREIFAVIFVLLTVSALSSVGNASVFRSYGKLDSNPMAKKIFLTGEPDPEMNYYYTGPESAPIAIMGLNKKYVLDNDLWTPIQGDSADPCQEVCSINSGALKDMIEKMHARALNDTKVFHGFVMYSPDGRVIGSWYSMIWDRAPIRMEEGNKVAVYTPERQEYPADL